MMGRWVFFVVNCVVAWRWAGLAHAIDGLVLFVPPFSLLCSGDTFAWCILQGPIIAGVLLAPPWLIGAFVVARVLGLLGLPCANAAMVARAFVLGFVTWNVAFGALVAFRVSCSVGHWPLELLKVAPALAAAAMGLLALLFVRERCS